MNTSDYLASKVAGNVTIYCVDGDDTFKVETKRFSPIDGAPAPTDVESLSLKSCEAELAMYQKAVDEITQLVSDLKQARGD